MESCIYYALRLSTSLACRIEALFFGVSSSSMPPCLSHSRSYLCHFCYFRVFYTISTLVGLPIDTVSAIFRKASRSDKTQPHGNTGLFNHHVEKVCPFVVVRYRNNRESLSCTREDE